MKESFQNRSLVRSSTQGSLYNFKSNLPIVKFSRGIFLIEYILDLLFRGALPLARSRGIRGRSVKFGRK